MIGGVNILIPHQFRHLHTIDGQIRVGVSGTRHAGSDHFFTIFHLMGLMKEISDYTTVTHGCCRGADDLAAKATRNVGTDIRIRGILPAGWQGSRWIVNGDYNTEVEEMPNGTSLLDRDQRVVDEVQGLIAFPMHAEDHVESRRSGTWATIRMARRKGIPIVVLPLAR